MSNILMILVGLAALTFVLAVLSSLLGGGQLLGTPPEAYSRASTNLALLAIAWKVANDASSAGT